MATIDDVRRLALSLPRASEHLVRDRVKFRVGSIVFAAFSRDEQTMGFGFPREERQGLVDSDPVKFSLPSAGDLRYQWVHAQIGLLDQQEMTELVTDAWAMCVPAKVRREHFGG